MFVIGGKNVILLFLCMMNFLVIILRFMVVCIGWFICSVFVLCVLCVVSVLCSVLMVSLCVLILMVFLLSVSCL